MATEDLTTYTETDVAADRVAVTASAATVTNLDSDEIVRVIKDFTAGFFDALNIDFQVNFTGTSHGTLPARGLAVCLTNAVETALSGFATTDIGITLRINAGPGFVMELLRGNEVAKDTSGALTTDTQYYCTLYRAAGADTVTLKIYSDAGRITLVDTLSVAGYSTTTYRYLYAMMGLNSGATARAVDYVSQNINLTGGQHAMSVGGTLTTSGALQKQTNKAFAGTLTSVGALQKQVNKVVAGTLTMSGTLQKQINKVVAGTLYLVGTLSALRSLAKRLFVSARDRLLSIVSRDKEKTVPSRDRVTTVEARDRTKTVLARDRVLTISPREDE